MKHLIHLAVVLAATALGGIGGARADEIRACDFEVKARCVSGDARVTLAGGAIKRVEVNVIWCGEKGRPGYSCTIDSSRNDQDSKWSDEGGATLVANASPFNAAQPDRMKVTVGKYVSIDLARRNRSAGAAPARNCRARSSFRRRKAPAACGSGSSA